MKNNNFYSTREAYGDALVELGKKNPNIVVLDAEVANSTYENKFAKAFPKRFFQMFIAEQNMVSIAVGLSKVGRIPFLATFSAFLTRAFDQIRMAQYSQANLKIVGTHAGVSIGPDGPSQMGLEDLAMMRSILESTVFYPSDAVSTKKLIKIMARVSGIFYLRATREKTPVTYDEKEKFEIGGLKIHGSESSKILIIAAGVTLHEALKAQQILKRGGKEVAVVDLYSIKPLDEKTLLKLARKAKKIIVVEDHYPAGGIGEAVASLIPNFIHLCVKKIPMSGTPEELLYYEEIDAAAIVKAGRSS